MDKKTILICGYGISGQAAARLAAQKGNSLIIADEKLSTIEMRKALDELRKKTDDVQFLSNWHEGHPLPPCDEIILSPGVRKTSALYKTALQALRKNGKMIGELEFALQNLNCPFLAITGTNGKTTTTELTTFLLLANRLKAESAGNIGTALSDCALQSSLRPIDSLSIEISSFQLESLEKFPACPAAILNLASDHIDRHHSMEEYAALKFKLFAEPMSADKRIMNSNLRPWLDKFLPGTQVTTFSAVDPEADFTMQDDTIFFHGQKIYSMTEGHLQGVHNAENIMAALGMLRAVCGEAALFRPETANALAEFRSSPHRIELFAEYNGVKYINDSKATNPHAVNAAVKLYGNGRNLLILLGGLDKGMDFSELEVSLPHIKQAYLIGSCREALFHALADKVKCKLCSNFESAVRDACSAAVPGDCVILSPATASMDMFKNYAERGDTFKQSVNHWIDVMKQK